MYSLILKIHSKFLERAINSSKLLSHSISATPTLIFLLASFVLIYQHLHRTTGPHTRWKTRLIRDLKFHWIYFNSTRLWFIFLACMKRINVLAEQFIDENLSEKEKNFNRFVTQAASLIIVTSLACVPLVLICFTQVISLLIAVPFYGRVMEDPYTRHEIGISGHCLERPLRVSSSQKLRNYSYRSKRSTSFDSRPWISYKPAILCRTCKSMIEGNVGQGNEDTNNKLKI